MLEVPEKHLLPHYLQVPRHIAQPSALGSTIIKAAGRPRSSALRLFFFFFLFFFFLLSLEGACLAELTLLQLERRPDSLFQGDQSLLREVYCVVVHPILHAEFDFVALEFLVQPYANLNMFLLRPYRRHI